MRGTAKVLNIHDGQDERSVADQLESEIADVVPRRAMMPIATTVVAMPEYVQHHEGASHVGKLSAEAVVREFEAAAKEIEAMGNDLMEAAKRCEAIVSGAHGMVDECKAVAQMYRERAKRFFDEIENVSILNEDVRQTCDSLRTKIAKPVHKDE